VESKRDLGMLSIDKVLREVRGDSESGRNGCPAFNAVGETIGKLEMRNQFLARGLHMIYRILHTLLRFPYNALTYLNLTSIPVSTPTVNSQDLN